MSIQLYTRVSELLKYLKLKSNNIILKNKKIDDFKFEFCENYFLNIRKFISRIVF